MNYDANLFCEIIESFQGVSFLRQEEDGGANYRFYQGPRGFIQLDYDDVNFTDNTGKGYLRQLGLEHLIPSMYPEETLMEKTVIPIVKEKSNENDCNNCNGIGQLEMEKELIACTECNGTGSQQLHL